MVPPINILTPGQAAALLAKAKAVPTTDPSEAPQPDLPGASPFPPTRCSEASEKPKDDVVIKPSHYARWVIEPITFIVRNGMEFWRGNIIKYVSRAGHKVYDGMTSQQSEVTDLRKAIRYAEIRINQLEGKQEL